MKFKGFFLLLSILLVFSSFAAGGNYVSADDSPSNTNELNQKTIDLVDNFIVFKDNNFVIENTEILTTKIGEEEFAKVNAEIADKNALLRELTTEELDSIAVVDNHVQFLDQNVSARASSKGKNALEVHWWGYKVFLNDNLTNTTAQALAGGSGTAALVSIWAPWFSAPTAIVKAVATSAVVVLGGSSAMFYKTNKGKGIYLRFTGILPANVIYTGMFSQ